MGRVLVYVLLCCEHDKKDARKSLFKIEFCSFINYSKPKFILRGYNFLYVGCTFIRLKFKNDIKNLRGFRN